MPLTDPAVRNAKPASKPYKLTDGDGLYLLVNHVGKYWRYDYRFLGKRKTLAFGVYPIITLADARGRRNQARKLMANGSDPGAIKQTGKREAKELAANTFEAVSREWHQKQSVKWVPKNTARILSLLERDIFPAIGKTPVAQVTAASLLSTVQKIEKRGNIETAHRAMQSCGQIFRYAIATGRAQADLSAVLKGAALASAQTTLDQATQAKGAAYDLLLRARASGAAGVPGLQVAYEKANTALQVAQLEADTSRTVATMLEPQIEAAKAELSNAEAEHLAATLSALEEAKRRADERYAKAQEEMTNANIESIIIQNRWTRLRMGSGFSPFHHVGFDRVTLLTKESFIPRIGAEVAAIGEG